MPSEKLENLLNLALDATNEEREKSKNLNVGFDEVNRTWELIVKYHGDILPLESLSIRVEPLIAGYAILTVPQAAISLLSSIEEIEYVEKPKRLFFEISEGKQASCVLQVTTREPYLTGRGVIVAVADSGIDYFHEAFRNQDGSTRILAIWDQSLIPDETNGWKSPDGFFTGVEFDRAQINEALFAPTMEEGRRLVPVRDISGHGTAVTAIAAGRELSGLAGESGLAPESEILVVKLGTPEEAGFPRTTQLMRAMTYLVKKSVEMGMPAAINVSFGNTYGAHDGSSLLERFMDNVAEIGKCAVCVGSGNEGAAMGHVAGNALSETRVELEIGNYELSLSVQIWKNYADQIQIDIISPGGERRTIMPAGSRENDGRAEREILEGTQLLIYQGEPAPYSVRQEIYVEFLPIESFLTPGIWSFIFIPVRVVTGNYSMYLPSQAVIGTNTHFFTPTPEMTLTIPSTASKVITVGAYNSVLDIYADFSGRGYVYAQDLANRNGLIQSKPDLTAPGVLITTAAPGGGYARVSGTSFAAPFVTGSAALLMQWGIVNGNDPYLYGEKVKAYLIKGARQLPGYREYPNPQVGWGALCVKDSLPFQ